MRTPDPGQIPLPELKEGEKKLCLELAIPSCELHTLADFTPPAGVSQLTEVVGLSRGRPGSDGFASSSWVAPSLQIPLSTWPSPFSP